MSNAHSFLARNIVAAAVASMLCLWSALPQQVAAASSWKPTLLINTEAFQVIDETDASANLELRFGDIVNETLRWDRTGGQFQLTDDLEVIGTASGDNLFATQSVTGAYLHASATIAGAGLTDCTGISNKLTWLSSTKQFACEADQTGAGATTTLQDAYGNDIDGGDATIALTSDDDSIIVSNPAALGSDSAFALQVDQNADVVGLDVDSEATTAAAVRLDVAGDSDSPHILLGHGGTFDTNLYRSAADTLRTSDAFIADGNLTFGDALADAVTVNAASWTFANDTNFALSGGVNGLSIDTDTLSVDATADRIGIGTTAPKTKLEIIGTASGQNLFATKSVTGSHLYAASTLGGAGLSNCTGTSNKLTWLSSTKQFACETDQAGGAAAGIDDHYVRASGDTMTGGLLVESRASGGGTPGTVQANVLLEVGGTASGRLIRAQDRLESSGSLVVDGATALNKVNYTWPATPASASGKVLKVNPTTGQLSWSADSTGGGGPSTVVSTANVSDSTTGGTNNVTGLTVPVSANTNYIIRCLLTTNSAATTTGVQITVNGPSSPTQVTWNRQSCSSTTALVHANINAFGTEDVRTASAGTTRCVEPIRIHLRNGANAGNVTFSVDTEIASSAVTVYTGSFCDYQSY